MKGIVPFSKFMRCIEREEIRQELLKEWYQQRGKNFFFNKEKTPVQNN